MTDKVIVALFPPVEDENPGEVLRSMMLVSCPKKSLRDTLSSLLTGTDPAFEKLKEDERPRRLAYARAPWLRREHNQREQFLLPSPLDTMVLLYRLERQQECTENAFSQMAWLHSPQSAKGGALAVVHLDDEGFYRNMTEDLAEGLVLSYAAYGEEWEKQWEVAASRSVLEDINTSTTILRPSQEHRLRLMLERFGSNEI